MKKTMILLLCLAGLSGLAQTRSADSVMITVFLKHQEDKNLDSLQTIQKKNKFGAMFPPAGARVVSWYVMMGIGQVVTLKVPAAKLRDLNLAIEKGAWGAFKTEFYPTYDYAPLWEAERKKSAVNKRTVMQVKLLNNNPQQTFALILESGEETMACLKQFARENKLTAASFTAIGAFSNTTVGFF